MECMSSQPPFLKRQVATTSRFRSKKRCLIHHMLWVLPWAWIWASRQWRWVQTARSSRVPKALRTELKRLKRLHRRLSRKEKGSKNREKARKRLARKYARIAHVRRNAHHQATSRLTRAHFSPEERAARRAQIASTFPEPKAKVKPRKGKRSLATQTLEAPPLSEMVAQKVEKEADKAEAKAGQRVGRRPMSTSGGAGRPPRRGDEAKPQASSCYQRCGLGGVSTANGLQDRVARGSLPACRPLLPLDQKMLQPDVWRHQRGDGPL